MGFLLFFHFLLYIKISCFVFFLLALGDWFSLHMNSSSISWFCSEFLLDLWLSVIFIISGYLWLFKILTLFVIGSHFIRTRLQFCDFIEDSQLWVMCYLFISDYLWLFKILTYLWLVLALYELVFNFVILFRILS